jgi:putative phage-type endonuclease
VEAAEGGMTSTALAIVPEAHLVTDAAPDTDEWFAARREGITATDLPKILGVSLYGNATSVWASKVGLIPDDPGSEAAYWGTVLEPLVADRWADVHSASLAAVGVLANDADPWRRASLDRVVLDCPDGEGPCPLQIKTRSAFKGGEWREDVPDDVLAQEHWEMSVTGYRHAHVACLLGGQRLVEHRIDWDPAVADLCAREAETIWRHVQDGTRPLEDATELLGRVLDAMYPDRSGAAVLTREQADLLTVAYADACEREKQAKAAKAAARAAILDALGPAEQAVIRDALGLDRPVFTYRPVTRAAHQVAAATYRTLRLVKGALDDPDQ